MCATIRVIGQDMPLIIIFPGQTGRLKLYNYSYEEEKMNPFHTENCK